MLFPQPPWVMLQQHVRKQGILESLNLEDPSAERFAPSRLRDREGFLCVSARVLEQFTPCHRRTRLLNPKACLLTRFMTLISMATLVVAVLWRSSADYRMPVGVIVSTGAIVLVVRSLLAHKFILGVVFLGILGVFTPFRSGQFSHTLVSILDMAALALFAASPIMLRKSLTPVASSPTAGVLRPRPFVNQPE